MPHGTRCRIHSSAPQKSHRGCRHLSALLKRCPSIGGQSIVVNANYRGVGGRLIDFGGRPLFLGGGQVPGTPGAAAHGPDSRESAGNQPVGVQLHWPGQHRLHAHQPHLRHLLLVSQPACTLSLQQFPFPTASHGMTRTCCLELRRCWQRYAGQRECRGYCG